MVLERIFSYQQPWMGAITMGAITRLVIIAKQKLPMHRRPIRAALGPTAPHQR
jgi:hypothetical protein